MAEDPEEVLPQHRRAAGLRVEEVRAEEAVEQQHHLRRGERRQSKQDRIHTTSSSQTNSGMRHSVMPGQRMQNTVVMRFAAVAMLPMPLTSRPTIQ